MSAESQIQSINTCHENQYAHFRNSDSVLDISIPWLGGPYARDNVAQFIAWSRALGVPESVMFVTNDLVEVGRAFLCGVAWSHKM